MKKPTRLVFYSALALLLAAIPATLLAAGHGRGFGRGHGGPYGGGFVAERIAEHLDLSEEQRDQIRTVHEGYREETESLMETMRVARRNLQESIHDDLFDEAAIREAAGQVAAVEADLAVQRARISSDVHQVLTPEQVAEAQALRERMRDFAGGWLGHHRWERRGFDAPPTEGE